MKRLFDQNLSFKLVGRLADLFPESDQVRRLGLDQADDHAIWHYAKLNGFVLVTQDSDFADLVALFGPPPKIVWLRCGNQFTQAIEELLRRHAEAIKSLGLNNDADCLEIF